MFLLGTIVNCLLILIGSFLGTFFRRIPERLKGTVMHGIALAVILLGLQMGLQTENFLVVILSLVFGAIIGEYYDLEEKLNRLGDRLEKKIGNGNGESGISQAFVTATLLYCIGAMAIIGALDSGIRGDHSVLYTKGILDGFTALILTTSLGIGVVFSAIPVFLYQGSIALFATQIDAFVPKELLDSFITEMTSAGGLMIVAIGLNMLGLTKIRVANLLPGILVVAFIVAIIYYGAPYFG